MKPASGLQMPAPDALKRAVGRDLAWLARELGSPVESAVPVSPLRGRTRPRGAWRVDLADGRRVKLRRLSEPDEARTLERLLATLEPVGLPQVLARHGRTLVLEWVPGTPFDDLPHAPEHVAQAAALLGRIHATPGFEGRALPEPGSSSAELTRANEQLAALVQAGRLTAHEAAALGGALEFSLPTSTTCGVVHGDFAPENLVLDARGALRVVDNESVRMGVLDLDLARVWSRWPLPEADWHRFVSAYGEAAGRSTSDDDLSGWKLRTLIVSAWYRTAFGLDGAEAVVGRLRDAVALPGCVHLDPSTPGGAP